jgi:hypothetical protein
MAEQVAPLLLSSLTYEIMRCVVWIYFRSDLFLLSSVDGEGIFEAAQGFPEVTHSAMFMFFHVVYCVCVNVFIF